MPSPIDLLPLLEQATRAPSSHNTQPWLFRARDEALELFADRTRALPVNDPYDRELTISCGAALAHLEVAVAAAGHGTRTRLVPDAREPDHLATLTWGGAPDAERAALARWIDGRRSTREPFGARALPAGLIEELAGGVEREACWLEPIEGEPRRERLAGLVAEGDRAQFADPRWRRELANWMHPRRKGDGLMQPELVAPVSRAVVRAFDLGASTGAKDRERTLEAPLVAVLGSRRDETEDWLRAGLALGELALRAAAHDVQIGYLNQPCQVAELRTRLQSELDLPGFPQLVLRLGHAPAARHPSSRRPVADVLLDADA